LVILRSSNFFCQIMGIYLFIILTGQVKRKTRQDVDYSELPRKQARSSSSGPTTTQEDKCRHCGQRMSQTKSLDQTQLPPGVT
jgi:hypothetical protein